MHKMENALIFSLLFLCITKFKKKEKKKKKDFFRTIHKDKEMTFIFSQLLVHFILLSYIHHEMKPLIKIHHALPSHLFFFLFFFSKYSSILVFYINNYSFYAYYFHCFH
ncbi:hypothetical protein HMI54_001250 [Coelomomyces lativittatus]|nr:hypothetical protein HMI54_001250 [Coelomomyces lativittatus]